MGLERNGDRAAEIASGSSPVPATIQEKVDAIIGPVIEFRSGHRRPEAESAALPFDTWFTLIPKAGRDALALPSLTLITIFE